MSKIFKHSPDDLNAYGVEGPLPLFYEAGGVELDQSEVPAPPPSDPLADPATDPSSADDLPHPRGTNEAKTSHSSVHLPNKLDLTYQINHNLKNLKQTKLMTLRRSSRQKSSKNFILVTS